MKRTAFPSIPTPDEVPPKRQHSEATNGDDHLVSLVELPTIPPNHDDEQNGVQPATITTTLTPYSNHTSPTTSSGKSSGSVPHSSKPRSLRISGIPSTVSTADFRNFLEQLLPSPAGCSDENVLLLSLVPFLGGAQVATVCFKNEPRVFATCSPGATVYITFTHEGKLHELVVDCDFFGLTPLYCSSDPTEEYVYPESLYSMNKH
ncbi:hypothetical protein EX30DRAFT_199508 [Ascodesmis nigricans]|uniref:Uncharacterized protein n=1 Tax=Ascodesmis nigricans TaxID=341454 RepID=A0A4S2MKI3_9PEZI|nr:hypothetical protein EX30DRAFT_199508 [Ascodesmis nigricans]